VPEPARRYVPAAHSHPSCAVVTEEPLPRGLHSFPFPLNLSLLCPFQLNVCLLCPPYIP
jgi:hypothetical protein